MWGAPLNRLGRQMKKKWEKAAQLMLTPFPSASVTAAVTVHSWPLLLHSSHAGSYQWISRKLLDFNFGLRPSLPTSPPLWGFWLFGVGNYWTEQLLGSKVSQYIKFELTSNHISQSTKKKNSHMFFSFFWTCPSRDLDNADGIWGVVVSGKCITFLILYVSKCFRFYPGNGGCYFVHTSSSILFLKGKKPKQTTEVFRLALWTLSHILWVAIVISVHFYDSEFAMCMVFQGPVLEFYVDALL